MDDFDLSELAVVVPNLHWNYTGVTATNRMVAPRIAKLMPTAWLGTDAPEGMTLLTWRGLMRLRFVSPRRPRIWHARRNHEMIVGVLLRSLGWPFKLVFTSAAQRRHSRFTRFLIARMDAVIATSEASASYLDRPAAVVLHGIDPQIYHPPPDRDAEFVISGLPGRFAIGCFGRVRPQKGTDVFVEAMCALLPDYPDYSAVVIGPVTPDQRAFARALEARVEAAGLTGRVRFLGELPIDEVPHWYQRLTIYAFTSRVEGFGLTLLEAMSSGVALVAARAGGAERVVIDGETGILVPPGDVDALIAALEPLMRDPELAEEMGGRARESVLQYLTVDAEAERIATVYRWVLEKK